MGGAALLAAQRQLVVLAGLVQWVGGTGQSGLQLHNTCTQAPQLLGVSTQLGQLELALLGMFGIAAKMLTQALDVVAGPAVGGIVVKGLSEGYRGRESLHRCPQLLTHCTRGVPACQVV